MGEKLSNKELSHSNITNIKTAANELIRTFYENGVNPETIKKSVSTSIQIVELVNGDDFIDSIKVFKDFNPYALTHPFMVSLISVMICKRLDWNTDRTLKAVALGGLLHDVGLTKLPEQIRFKSLTELSKEDLEIYQTHAEVGMNLVNEYAEIPAAVQQIILQHHEINGKGYPNGLSVVKIFPLAKIVCLADRFSKFILEKDLLLVDGLKPFISDKTEMLQHDPDIIRALIKSFIKEEKKK